MNIKKSTRRTSVQSNVKKFYRRKDGRGKFLVFIFNYAGDTKYCAILKNSMYLLQTIKWNVQSYPLETHVSNNRQAVEDIWKCATQITTSVPDKDQRVEYMINRISCSDNTLQSAIRLVHANTNNMRHDFETAASTLIEVDPYKRDQKNPSGTGRQAHISGVNFSG